ncbi:MAG: hypothetical protein FJ164_07200 [Gammaproteobacteria bacterium]|nr:hypothetical protein [Gammaproteobacteria bacterium]
MHPTRFLVALLAATLALVLPSVQATELATPLEKNGHARISTSAEIGDWMRALAARHPDRARVEVLGHSVQGREILVLHLAAPHAEGASPGLRVMVTASQHGAAEPAGGEALLAVARQILEGDRKSLLEDLDLIFVPNANPDGRDLGRRSNANRINLNVDFVLLTQPENRLLRDALYAFAPDALLDSHESAVLKRKTLAKEGYLTDFDAQFEYSNNPSVPAALRDYARQTFLPAITARVSAGGLPAHRYIGEITSLKQPITHGGLTLRNFRNTAGLSGTLAILVETKLDSRDDTWPTWRNIEQRVARQILCINSFLDLTREQADEIKAVTTAARQAMPREPLTLYAGYERDKDHPTVHIPMRRIDTRALEDIEFRDHRKQINADTLPLPPMLAIARHADLIQPVLERHSIRYLEVEEATRAEVMAARLEVTPDMYARGKLLAETRKTVTLEAGSLLIDTAQPGGRVAVLLLDPRATSSLFRYPEYAQLIRPTEDFFVYRTFKGATRSTP